MECFSSITPKTLNVEHTALHRQQHGHQILAKVMFCNFQGVACMTSFLIGIITFNLINMRRKENLSLENVMATLKCGVRHLHIYWHLIRLKSLLN